MAQDYNLEFNIKADGVPDAEEQFLALGKSIDKARQELDEMRESNQQGTAAFKQQKQELTQMEEAFRELNKEMKGVDATFEDIYGEVQPLTTALGEAEDRLYQLALAGDTTSKEYQELLDKVSRYRKVQIDTDMVVDAAATTFSQKLGGALQGAASGFAGVQGAIGLFGVESEALESTLLKVNSAMALADGISGLREGMKSFKALGLAAKNAFKGMSAGLAATGIGLFIVALGTVVAYWDDIASAIGLANDELEESKALQEKLEAQYKKDASLSEARIEDARSYIGGLSDMYKREAELLEANGATEEEVAAKKIRAMEVEVDMLKDIAKERNENYIEASKNTKIGSQEYDTALAKMRTANNNLIQAEHNLEVQRVKDHQKELDRLKELEEQRKADRQRRRARFITQRDDRLAFERELEDLRLAQMVEGGEKELALLNLQYDRIREDINNNEKLTASQKKQLIIEQEKIREQELFRIRRDFFVAEKDATLLKAKEIETAKTELIIDQERIRDADAEDRRKKRIAKAKETALALAQITVDGLRLISDIAELNAGKDEKRARRAFNIKKAADIAEATMSGYKAVLSTYANAPGGPVLKGIAAGIAGGFAAVQIGKIASAQFQSGDSGGGGDLGSDVPSGGDVAVAAPQFNVVGDTGASQLAQIQQQPMQAFVVSGDVTSAQSLDRNKIQNATI